MGPDRLSDVRRTALAEEQPGVEEDDHRGQAVDAERGGDNAGRAALAGSPEISSDNLPSGANIAVASLSSGANIRSMPTQSRRERAREERRDLIVRTARDLAETEGWDAVTTRRLAEAVDYSQPVLYGHFKNMDAIAGAVAVEGFAELAAVLRDARETDGLSGIAHAYLEYAEQHPAVYEAMSVRRTDLIFGGTHTPEPLQTAFAEILAAVQPYARGDAETATEVFWSALHGQATLNHTHRLRPSHTQARVDLLITRLTA